MKSIKEFITESKKQVIDPKDIKGPVTAGDYNGADVVIIGKPFTNENDEAYAVAKEFMKKLGLKNITMDLKDCYNELGEYAEDVEYWVFASQPDGEVSCFEYGPSGVVAYK